MGEMCTHWIFLPGSFTAAIKRAIVCPEDVIPHPKISIVERETEREIPTLPACFTGTVFQHTGSTHHFVGIPFSSPLLAVHTVWCGGEPHSLAKFTVFVAVLEVGLQPPSLYFRNKIMFLTFSCQLKWLATMTSPCNERYDLGNIRCRMCWQVEIHCLILTMQFGW